MRLVIEDGIVVQEKFPAHLPHVSHRISLEVLIDDHDVRLDHDDQDARRKLAQRLLFRNSESLRVQLATLSDRLRFDDCVGAL